MGRRRLLQIQKHPRYFTWRHGHWHSAQDGLTDKSSESLKNSVAGGKKKVWNVHRALPFPNTSPAVSFLMILLSHPCTTSQPLRWANGMWRPIRWEELSGCQVNLWKRTHLTPAGGLWHQRQPWLTHFSRDWRLKTTAYTPKVSSCLISITQRSNKSVRRSWWIATAAIKTITRVARRPLSLLSIDFSFFLHCCMCGMWDVCN